MWGVIVMVSDERYECLKSVRYPLEDGDYITSFIILDNVSDVVYGDGELIVDLLNEKEAEINRLNKLLKEKGV